MTLDLEALARGEVPPEEASPMIEKALPGAGPATVYAALLRAIWPMLSGHRGDREMRVYHRTLLHAAHRMEIEAEDNGMIVGTYPDRLRGQADMLRLAIDSKDRPRGADLLAKAYVIPILDLLRKAPGQTLGQGRIAAAFGLRPATVSHFLALMEMDGMISRESWGAIRLSPGAPRPDDRETATSA